MHPSVNYDYVIHGDHIHWCNVEARGMTRCEELAMREHSTITADAAFADVALSILIAMGVTIVAGAAWGVRQQGRFPDRNKADASITSQPMEIGA